MSNTTRFSADEHAARGREARSATPRSSQANFDPGTSRPDPIDVLESQAATRIAELLPIRYGRMLVSPFAFYRGAAKIMAGDLATTPRTGFDVQCCGDAHLSNFGVFGSPERRLVFDINDFDETLTGPWEWDVKRLAASMLIAGRDNRFSQPQQEQVVLDTVSAYRTAMNEFAPMNTLAVWYASLDIESILRDHGADLRAADVPKAEIKQTAKQLDKARTRDSLSAFAKLTHDVDGQPRIVDQSPLIVPIGELAAGAEHDRLWHWLDALVSSYAGTLEFDRRVLLERFEPTDFARKVVGVGSVGTQAWIGLLLGRDQSDPLLLQIKQAEPSVLEEFLEPSPFSNHGERVVTGQRLMQSSSDIFLGWLRVDSPAGTGTDDFYCRQLKDWKGSVEVDEMSAPGMTAYGRLCGWTLARAHARSGDRIAIASYLGRGAAFDRAILEFAGAYAAQNEHDYEQLVSAVKSGRIRAETGV